jgi:hypothetical protein
MILRNIEDVFQIFSVRIDGPPVHRTLEGYRLFFRHLLHECAGRQHCVLAEHEVRQRRHRFFEEHKRFHAAQ